MNRPARRDGTPDRGRSNPARKNTNKKDAPQRGSGSRGSAPRDSARGGESRGSYDRPERGSTQRGAAPRGGEARVSQDRTERGAAAGQAGAGKKPHRGQPAGAGKNKYGKPKASKPQRAQQAAPKVSNAKPARHQYADGPAPAKLPAGEGMRLQKVLAQAGVASRRAAEELIEQGRVEVDGRIVVEQGLRVDPENAVVRVDGVRVVVKKDLVHIALNKPRGWQSTMSDDLGRPCIGDIVSERVSAGQRLFHVGRLDADTEGLILLTNDGDLAHRLMHPSFEVPKTYLATVSGVVDRNLGKTLKAGVELEDGPAKVDSYALLDVNQGKSLVKIVLHEGRKHIVRRLLEAVGHPVVRLVRTDIGPVALGDGRPGTLRVIGPGEVGALYKAVGL
ncbi:rRNA pseudouridine synthase [Rhodococcus spelaei]|uniref:Pseudouridine synthase n=1 Tax=Rhodococcus spelaei TaxID=2546320 RepID=A0A541B7B2_9NOCA|nr:pseudouridine synthase [Rhodococcus spelaei]TQF68216.1 rRNA pseudouridine synthase [Rhodococcus spelaei]